MCDQKPHRKLVKHFHEPGDFHELTFSTYKRMRFLTNNDWRRRLSDCLNAACDKREFDLVAFVYMPEHVHLLVYPCRKDPDIGAFLASIKQPFSSQIKGVLEENRSSLLTKLTIRERPGKEVFRFWQEGPGYDRNINTPDALQSSINYIHSNPVTKGLVKKAVDWTWSSARYYLLEPTRQQFAELPFIHGIPVGAFDTDNQR